MEAAPLNANRKQALLAYMRNLGCGVVSTSGTDHAPEAAFVNLAVTDDLELIFETLNTSRKYRNLRRDPRIAVVMGGSGDKTVQLEGMARELFDSELDGLKASYYDQCPNNLPHSNWPGVTYIRIQPRWIRFSNYGMPWKVEEFFLGRV